MQVLTDSAPSCQIPNLARELPPCCIPFIKLAFIFMCRERVSDFDLMVIAGMFHTIGCCLLPVLTGNA